MPAESRQAMRIGGGQQRLVVRPGDAPGAAVEIEKALVKMADLDRVEAIHFVQEARADRGSEIKKRMRRETKKRVSAAGAQLPQVGESAKVFDLVRLDIEQDNVGSFQSHFGGRNEDDAHGVGVGEDFRPVENFIVICNGERAKAELAGAFEKLMRRVIELILRIVEGVDVQIDLDPFLLL